MKKKIYNICGVALVLVLVLSLFGVFAPVKQVEAQAYTPNRWNVMTIPAAGPPFKLLAGGDVTDFAVGSDGTTIYAVDRTSTAGTSILKSTTGGTMWSPVAVPTVPPAVAFTAPARLVAVAPDNPAVMAIVDSGGAGLDRVFFSTNGGSVWADLGIPGAGAAERIYDIAVSPANATALLGRNIVVATSDTTLTTYGDVYLIGATATWANVTGGLGLNTFDYTSVAFEPNWLGGQSVVAIGSGVVANGTFFQVLRTAPLAPAIVCNFPMAVTAAIGPGLGPEEVGGATATDIVSSTLALPSDFDSTAPPTIKAYVGFTSGTGADDVYRQDFNQTRKLQIAANVGIYSISFSGTLAGGTLFAGETVGAAVGAAAQVWYSANPQTALPSWSFSYKPPTGSVGAVPANVVVQVAPDFDTSGIVYAGTGGNVVADESAFSRSTNGGVSYNQIGLIDTTITTLRDVMPSPNNSTLFLTSSNGVPNSSLWRSTTPPSGGSWERVGLQARAGFIIRLSPDYLTDSTLYWADLGFTNIQKSTNGGEIFAPRTAAGNIGDLTVESQEIVYMAQIGTDNVYKSTNGCWYWGLPIPANTGGVFSIAMCPTYPEKPKAGNVLAGGVAAGAVSLSTDGAASFIPLLVFAPGGTLMQVLADKGYATNNIVYAGSSAAGQGIFRYEVGTSTAWESIGIPNGALTTGGERIGGLAMEGGTLYGAWFDFVGSLVTAPSGAERSLVPTVPDIVGGTFDTMDIGVPAGAVFNAVPSSLRAAGTATTTWLWAIDMGNVTLMAYQDTMAKAVLTVNVPATVPNDPSTGRNAAFNITFDKPSNALTYNVGVFTDADCTQGTVVFNVAFVPPQPLAPSFAVAPGLLSGGTKYYVRVFVVNQVPGDGIRSPFVPWVAKVVSLTVEAGTPVTMPSVGPTLLSPTPGDMNVPLRPGFSWSTMPRAEKYEFILATDSALTQAIGGTPVEVTSPNFQLGADLAYSTTYFYAVKVTAPTSSPQSIGSFTTMAKPVPPVEPPDIVVPPAEMITPGWIWAIVIIGAILVIAVVVLIVTTRRVP